MSELIDRKYTDEECVAMIESGGYPIDAPDWVIKEIRKKRRESDMWHKSPKEEMEDYMRALGASKKVGN